ncbi:MAG: hypothetical protein HUJ95_01775 [Bacteroidales bacterium]|nr:hypothetical protein [Bacteroidales bacterium]
MTWIITIIGVIVGIGLGFALAAKADETLEVKDVINFLREKGLAVSQDTEDSLTVKIYDTNVNIDVSKGRFLMSTSYVLGDDVNIDALKEANNVFSCDRVCLKATLWPCSQKSEEGDAIESKTRDWLSFSFENLCRNMDEFKHQYEWGVYCLFDGIEYHRQVYGKMIQNLRRIEYAIDGPDVEWQSEIDNQSNSDLTSDKQ